MQLYSILNRTFLILKKWIKYFVQITGDKCQKSRVVQKLNVFLGFSPRFVEVFLCGLKCRK